MNAAGTAADDRVNIGPRPVSQEPMVQISSRVTPLFRLTGFLRFLVCDSQLGNFTQLRIHRL